MKSRGSLGGQNSPGRGSGARSSRALSTMFKQLRKLDRLIGWLDRDPRVLMPSKWYAARRIALDQKRKEIRLKRKGYTTVVKERR